MRALQTLPVGGNRTDSSRLGGVIGKGRAFFDDKGRGNREQAYKSMQAFVDWFSRVELEDGVVCCLGPVVDMRADKSWSSSERCTRTVVARSLP